MDNQPDNARPPRPRFASPGWVAAALTLGLGLRCYHYLRDPSVWHDEAALALNVLGKSFAELLGPLFFSEAAPPLFLWVEKAAVGLLGDGTYALRLAPFLAGCGALLAVAAAARRALAPAAAFGVVLLFGCSDRLLWHGCEAKPYAVDVLVAAGLLVAFTHTAAWPLRRRLALAAGLSPGLVFLSYPACFLLGGLALCLLPEVARARRAGAWLLYASFLTATGVAFLLLVSGPVRAQRDATIRRCWSDMFPDWERPWGVPGWEGMRLLEVFRYACEPVGNVLFPVAVLGAVLLWRSGQRRLLAFLLLPLGLACLASLLGQYPFGATRVMAFAAPAALLLIGAGLPPALTGLRRLGPAGPLALAAVALFPVGQAAYRVGRPWDRFDSARAAALVHAHCRPGEAVVGTAWEHEYYFRDRPACFRYLAPAGRADKETRRQGDRETRRRVWLLAAGKTAGERRGYLAGLQASGSWRVVNRYDFFQTTVYCLQGETKGVSHSE